MLLTHAYDVWLSPERLFLFAVLAPLAVLAFSTLGHVLRLPALGLTPAWRGAGIVASAAGTLVAGLHIYERTDVIPLYVVCLTLMVFAALGWGRASGLLGPALFAGATCAWLLSASCVLFR